MAAGDTTVGSTPGHKGAGIPPVSKAPQKEPRNLGAFVIQSAASDIDEPEVPLHSPHQ